MKTGKTLHGSANLALDSVDAVTDIVEGMYRNISASPWPLGEEPQGNARGLAGFIFASIKATNNTVRIGSDWIIKRVAPSLDQTMPASPQREAIVSVINGVCGDHLTQTGNSLAIPMQLRVLLDSIGPQEKTSTGETLSNDQNSELKPNASSDTKTIKHAFEIFPKNIASKNPGFLPSKHLLIAVHGLCMSDLEWTSDQHNHIETLAAENDYTAIYALYNSGRHISKNGQELCTQIADLLETWPTAVKSITFVGYSMGGLLTRSALHYAKKQDQAWLKKVDKVVYMGTPHHGAVMERGGFWLHKGLTYSPYTSPLAALARVRSAGITDLRYGNVQDEDWICQDEHEDNSDNRVATPLIDGIQHYAIAASLSKQPGDRIGKLLGDGLVHPSSATGRHNNPMLELTLEDKQTRIFYDLGHLEMLHDARVMNQLSKWLKQ